MSPPAPDKTADALVMATAQASSLQKRISDSVIRQAVELAAHCQADALFINLDALDGTPPELPKHVQQRIFFVSKAPPDPEEKSETGRHIIRVPNVTLTRMGQVKIALLLAAARGLIANGDVIVTLTGLPVHGMLDTIVVMQVGKEFDLFLMPNGTKDVFPNILPEVLESVIDIAVALGSEGREGKPLGALFVIGDSDRVISLSRQLILNPFQGYPPMRRNILDPHLVETVKELAAIDGAFVIRGDGVIESAGTYLKTASQEEYKMPPGLGARHHAAAAITSVSQSVAITVSQSTGTVTIFRDGKIITELEKLRAGAPDRKL